MNKLASIAPVVLVLLSGCATSGQIKPGSCTPTVIQGPGELPTDSGLRFEVPAGFSATVECGVVSLDSDEFDLWVVELQSKDLEKAIAVAWRQVAGDFAAKVEKSLEPPAQKPYDAIRVQNYVVDSAKVFSQAVAKRRGDTVYVSLIRGTMPVLDKRSAQMRSFLGSMKLPGVEEDDLSGKTPESVKGRTEALDEFIASAMEKTGTPGLSLAVIEDGQVVYAKGYGVRELGKLAVVDADTLMMIGSVSKSMSTLMMASLVDEGKLAWDAKVTDVYPKFALADQALTVKLQIQHLVCACAGLPRKDMPLVLENEGKSAADVFRELAAMKPSTGFKETFQYQNHMVAAGGYVAALATAPEAEPFATYAALMDQRVFGPMGMSRTTLDLDRAAKDENHATPHSQAIDGQHRIISLAHERFATYIGPSGGIWSTAREMAGYLITEMNGGLTADGKRVVSKENLEKRWAPQVAASKDVFYGLGWMQAKKKGLRIIAHGGGTMGFATKVAFYPDKRRGVVMISNGTGGHLVEGLVQVRLDELWFGIDERLDERLAFALDLEKKERARVMERAKAPTAKFIAPLLGQHSNPELGLITIEDNAGTIELDAGTYRTQILVYARPDGRTSLLCIDPPLAGVELVLPEEADGSASLVLERGQERYELTKRAPAAN